MKPGINSKSVAKNMGKMSTNRLLELNVETQLVASVC